MTGCPCQKRIKRKLYPNNIGFSSRRYEVDKTAVAILVAVLIPQIQTI